MNQDQKGPWYLITGLLLGLITGVLYTFLFDPVQYVEVSPRVLSESEKDQYRGMIALSFHASGDLGRAAARLDLLEDKQVNLVLEAQAQRYLSDGQYPDMASALAELAQAIENPHLYVNESDQSENSESGEINSGNEEEDLEGTTRTIQTAQAVRTATPQKKATITPVPTFTPRVTAVPSEVLGASFVLQDKRKVCDPEKDKISLEVEVIDPAGNPIPGVKLEVKWETGQDYFFTGLYPHISLGYADFEMSENVIYQLKAGTGGEIIRDLQAEECVSPDGESYIGGWYLTFIQP